MMIEASKIRNAGLPLQAGMLLCFSFMSIYWIRIVQIGKFSVETYHVGLLCIIIATCASLYSPAAIFRVVTYCAPWFIAFLAYLVVLIAAVAGTKATGLITKQALFIVGFVCIAAFFLRTPKPARLLRLGALCGLAFYILVTEYSAHKIGKSLFSAIIDFLASGSFQALIFKFFRPVFNSFANDPNDPDFSAALTNSIAIAVFVLSVAFRIGHSRRGVDIVGSAVTVAVLFLSLLLNCRSVLLAGVASVAIAFGIRLIAARAVSLTELLYWCLILIAFVGFASVVALHGTSALESVSSVFEFTDDSAASRVNQYTWALGLINEQLFWGHGYVETEGGLPIHDLFLSSWTYVGFIGFALVLVFYIGLVYAWLRWLYFAIIRQNYWVLGARLEWVAVLPVLPLFRMWISGAGGLPAQGEWVALGLFVGLVMRNDVERQRLAEGLRFETPIVRLRRRFSSRRPVAAFPVGRLSGWGSDIRFVGDPLRN
jgi:hypothetical protein